MKNRDKILITTDFNQELLDVNLRFTQFLTKTFVPEITLLHIVEEAGFFSKLFGNDSKEAIEIMNKKLMELAENIKKDYGLDVKPFIKHGRITDEIYKYAEENEIDLILVGTSNPHSEDYKTIGANTHRLIRIANTPIITLNANVEISKIKNILLPLELTIYSRQKVRNAIEWAKDYGAEITLLSGLWDKGNELLEKELNLVLNNTRQFIVDSGVECSIKMFQSVSSRSDFAEQVAFYANEPENNIDMLMIMGKEETADFLINTAAQRVIRFAERPVFCVPAREIGMIQNAVF